MYQEPQAAAPTNQQVDKYVASKIRERRIALGFTQQMLAKRIKVTYQQAQKYERGTNRVTAGRLFEIARVLGVSISYFYEGIEQGVESDAASPKRHHMDLVRNFSRIENAKHQNALRQLCRSLAEG
ncbi:helix-turn-helix domain-containing protein [Pelagibius sp. Alg239-R121]|uniref:helix-turn-helix domain-containing protein n=1 Tax=Pelagibius sp. Alg239-R121 TaxID=2993448 RepID=UPI0024A66633|nr:helix-turn-helix transcriptional regulator [Pelagibius sp. Alg239-R121]